MRIQLCFTVSKELDWFVKFAVFLKIYVEESCWLVFFCLGGER